MSSPLNRQPAPRNEMAVEMLREKKLKKYAAVVTSDGHPVGTALRLRYRTEDIDPALKLYASYLEVMGAGLGNQSYIPTDFIADYDPEEDVVTLAVTDDIIKDETWNRAPTFIARREDTAEQLPLE